MALNAGCSLELLGSFRNIDFYRERGKATMVLPSEAEAPPPPSLPLPGASDASAHPISNP